MNLIRIGTRLEYEVRQPCSFYFSIAAERTARQTVLRETLALTPPQPYATVGFGEGGRELIRLQAAPGRFALDYSALVRLDPSVDDPSALAEVPFAELPGAVLHYLNPSRYCESDKLHRLVGRAFGDVTPGFARVAAVCDWVRGRLDYVGGSTDASSSAGDVLLQRAGVCRDFAHVGIALLRALGIPARYVSGYGVGVDPPDFHGFLEAWLDGDWYLFDPTGMAAVDGLVRIGCGRDAADVAFATFVGNAVLTAKTVVATRVDGTGPDAPAGPDGATATA